MKLRLSSTGLHSTWIYAPEFGFLLDAGEGVATHLRDQLYSVSNIFLSHAHTDHIAGLPTLLYIRKRQSSLGPVRIYYPENTPRIAELQAFIGELDRTEWIPIREGAEIQIGTKHIVRAFATNHIHPDAPFGSLGYVFFERRTRLKAEYAGLPHEQVRALGSQGKQMSEPFLKSHFAYTGDTAPLSDETLISLGEPDVLIHDATYLNEADLGTSRHSTLAHAQAAAATARAKRLVGFHLSIRYNDPEEPRIIPDGVQLVPPDGRYLDISTN